MLHCLLDYCCSLTDDSNNSARVITAIEKVSVVLMEEDAKESVFRGEKSISSGWSLGADQSQSEPPLRGSAAFDGNLHPLPSSNEHVFRCLHVSHGEDELMADAKGHSVARSVHRTM